RHGAREGARERAREARRPRGLAPRVRPREPDGPGADRRDRSAGLLRGGHLRPGGSDAAGAGVDRRDVRGRPRDRVRARPVRTFRSGVLAFALLATLPAIAQDHAPRPRAPSDERVSVTVCGTAMAPATEAEIELIVRGSAEQAGDAE